ncbi:MAG: glutamine--fructose-6-phosphate transaminase (isomerizing) [Armatimonadota bacterium]|nr:glutamine--fructose-6-phosphate transaminase (isomerizing) [Armatimonadota bacterium]MDR7533571.1 glutamine--fructose-6-phosphate transaminase (isomerizing) [Armatimonadota bacterium]MDR7537371.1 glutamine--fructose-6-phosphate transaminase (isomerizing) [Armatimonadota bacterium]
MCGIMGYVGTRQALPILLDGLRRLEYRGYDSAGVAVLENGRIAIRKAAGKLRRLERVVAQAPLAGSVGIGHTRWATHGHPTDTNAHPHSDCTGRCVVIHNGIIENYLSLREALQAEGHRFASDTDTEVLAHLIEAAYAALPPGTPGRFEVAVRQAIRQARGAYAIVVMLADEPDRIVAVRMISPLIVGIGQGEMLLASDIPALLPYTRDVLVISDGEMAVIEPSGVRLMDLDGRPVARRSQHIPWDAETAEKGGYAHFMLKEIYEQPRALQDTMMGRLDLDDRVELDGIALPAGFIDRLETIWLTACGTAYHAGLVGRRLLEQLARIPVEPDLASELRYRDPLIQGTTLAVAISQSGETADTLAAAREARARGARLLAVTNVVGSTLAREADDVLYIRAGPEIAVASTKAYVTMLVAMQMLAIHLGLGRGTLARDAARRLIAGLRHLPRLAQEALQRADAVAALAARLAHVEHAFFIGRGLDYAVAMEGSLKLKEISYLHSEALAAGELKHGTLALVTPETPVFALVTQRAVYEKTLANIQEVRARGAEVVAVAYDDDREIGKHAQTVLRIPPTDDLLAPVLAIIPLQLFAYHVAVLRGHDIDQPRNLAKSVTVE